MKLRVSSFVLALALAAPAPAAPPVPVDSQRLRAHVAFLADDLLEGRGPGTRGGQLAEKYVASQMAALGLLPAGDGGTYFQKVPLVGVTTRPSSTLTVGDLVARPGEDTVIWTDAQRASVDASAEVVFVGYGIEAPEYRWDDFKGTDVKGKILLMLVNDPPATAKEPDLFKGRGLTYYGRWTYKLESAARHGARGALLVHTDESASYGWDVVRNSWSGESSQNRLDRAERDQPQPLQVGGWLSRPFVEKVLQKTGTTLAALQEKAASRDFRPMRLQLPASAKVESSLRLFDASNVVGMLPGTDPRRKDEVVVFGGHVDHLGVGSPDATGDAIFNGARDNAAGVASVLEIARTVAAEGGWPRTTVFLGVAAEEQGLKGSAWYAAHPLFPPAKTAAYVNLDGAGTDGEVDDFTLAGAERSPELERIANDVAKEMSIRLEPDAHPEAGRFYRSDHFNFARIGVPCINMGMGESLRGKPAATGATLQKEYRTKRYHRPADQLDDSWDFRGLAQYATVAREIGRRVAALPGLPGWKPGDEFKAARDGQK